jgi:hypothetical protein
MTAHEKQQGVADAAVARAELYDTLSQLKDRLNYAQRVDDAVDEAKLRIAEQKRRNPLGFAAGRRRGGGRGPRRMGRRERRRETSTLAGGRPEP